METEQSIYSQATGWIKKSGNGLDRLAQLVFLFGNKDLLKEQKNIDFVKGAYPFAQVVGCSTSGEICQEEIFNHNIVCTAIWFQKTRVEIASERFVGMEDSFTVGEKLAEKLAKDELVHILVLSEG